MARILQVDANVKGLWRMNEASWNGTPNEIIDASGNGNHGTAKNGANTAAGGRFARCGSFDGTNDYIELVADGSTLGLTTAATFEFWINLDTGGDIRLFGYTRDWTANGQWLFWGGGYPDNPYICFNCYQNDTSSNSFKYIDLIGQWHYLVGVWVNGRAYLYVDAKIQNTGNLANGNLDNNSKISLSTSAVAMIDGKLDEARISDIARTANEIWRNYNQGKKVFSL